MEVRMSEDDKEALNILIQATFELSSKVVAVQMITSRLLYHNIRNSKNPKKQLRIIYDNIIHDLEQENDLKEMHEPAIISRARMTLDELFQALDNKL